ncbi:MAG: sigma-54 dependent transcriptional regulator, partial [Gammaproteobacteria bacterium]
MAGLRFLLIDDDQIRTRQFQDILEFLEYRVEIVASQGIDEYGDCSEGDIAAIFVGDNLDKQARIIKAVAEKTDTIPIIMLKGRGSELLLSSALEQLLFEQIDWPATYTEFNKLLGRLPTIATEEAPVKEAPIASTLERRRSSNRRLKGNSKAIVQVCR